MASGGIQHQCQQRAGREAEDHALERGGHVPPELAFHRELDQRPDDHPRSWKEDGIEQPEQNHQP
jgi:hypothetical protein